MRAIGRTWLALLGCVVIAAPAAGQQQGRQLAAARETLGDRMQAFLRAARSNRDSVASFFPRMGDLTWVHTLHDDEGTHVGVWRFPPPDMPRALEGNGPLGPSFHIDVEGQPVGLFLHQLIVREGRHKQWRRVGTRFVPLDEPATAGLFVEWRREAGVWVVSAFGDERYRVSDNRKLPAWCC